LHEVAFSSDRSSSLLSTASTSVEVLKSTVLAHEQLGTELGFRDVLLMNEADLEITLAGYHPYGQ